MTSIIRNRWSFVFFALWAASSLRGAELFPQNSDWRWRPGTNEASAPVTAWRDRLFNDTQFTAAPSPFWFGDVLPGGTQITGMEGVYASIFLRKSFVITNVAEVGALRMSALVDDGFVAWINGTEVLRVSMNGVAGDPVTISTLAINATEPVSVLTYNLPTPPSYLVVGTNVLAVQVFQSAVASSDLGFNASLTSILSETNPPTILSVSPAAGTINNLNEILVTFSEPVTGVDAAHLLVNGVGATSFTAIDSATYRFSFVQPPYGNVAITWSPNHNIFDQAVPPNRFNATGPGATWTYSLVDHTPPIVAALTPGAGAPVRTLTSITVLFSESVSGVNASDLLINNVPAAGLTTVAANNYIFTFPQPTTGAVQVAWAQSHGIIDQADSPNAFAGGNWNYQLDPNAVDASPYISEFLSSNTRTLADENGFFEDWIEIYNPSGAAVNLDGWYLTDAVGNLTKWRFPATNLAGGQFLVVFASGNDRRVPGARLHTSFQLSAGGEYLALVKPDGTIASEFSPVFPQQVADVSYGFSQSGSPPGYTPSESGVYFTTPTPGAVNLGGTAIPGPIIDAVQHAPNVPLDQEDLLVTARVRPSFRAVASVSMRYRIMFSNEVTTPMFDDGAHGDGVSGDGIYGATIPANLSTNGQMIRYLVAATDVNANASRWPLFTSPTNSEEYLGTIVDPTNVTSKLPIFHLFAPPTVLQPGPTTAQIGADSEAGGRVAIFYDGEFYDNIYMELRGNTSAGLNKKAHRIEFNRGHEFRHAGPGGRTRKSSLLAEHLDPAYLRQHLCFWLLNQIGDRAPYDYPVRLQLNGQFYQLAFHNDIIGQEQIERLGYDPKGALYKAVGVLKSDFFSTGVFQKLEPDNDASRTDYLQLANGIVETATTTVRRNSVFDLLDVPEVINHLAATRWCAENDDVWANMSMYRDTFGDQLWRTIPFDMNASWGQRYGGITPLDTITDSCKSHPLYGGSATPACDAPGPPNNFNRLYDVIIALPETRQMLLRRMRSIMDQIVQPPSTPPESLIIENYIKYMTNLISVEANLDRAKWGFSSWAAGKTFSDGVSDLLTQFVGPRRQHFYGTHCITNSSKVVGIGPANNAGIPLGQPANVFINIVAADFNPSGGNQEHEFICLSNPLPFAVDITGWKIEGGIDFTFTPGTVLPSNGVAYVSPNTRAFRARTTGPSGGQGLFVLGPYKGQLSARGETISVKNTLGRTLTTYAYPGAPSAAQNFLRVTELMYNPEALAGNPNDSQNFEYVELKNISPSTVLDLSGVHFLNGIDFSFTGSAITSLQPGQTVLVVRNQAAFVARYGAGLPIAGQFNGNLDNAGERIQLLDAQNEEILDFTYNNKWYPITDGLGFSLVAADLNASPDDWNLKTNWRPSGEVNGSPIGTDPVPPTIAPILVNEVLSRTETPPPTDSIELYNPTAQEANISGWYLSDDFVNPKKFRIPNGTSIPARGYLVFNETQFNTGPDGFAFSSNGDEVYLFSAQTNGFLTGYYHGFSFGAADNGVSFGRHRISTGQDHFVAQSQGSLGQTNSGPRVGPVVIGEIMYRPPEKTGEDNSQDEFIELVNISGLSVGLFDPAFPTRTWQLTDAVDFTFGTNTTLAAGERILLVNFDPANATALADFRLKYGVGPAVRVFGPYGGKLDNSSDSVELKKPATLPGGIEVLILVDKAEYEQSLPWPTGADGFGLSLQRINESAYGNDPANWLAAPPTAGASRNTGGSAPVITSVSLSQVAIAGANASFNVSATGSGTLKYQWRVNGQNIAGAISSTLLRTNVSLTDIGDYEVVVYNASGSVLSGIIAFDVLLPASITSQPQSVTVAPLTNVTFSVQAFSPNPLTYQWRKNGVSISGGNAASLALANVDLSDDALYDVIVTDPVGSIVSSSARLKLLIRPVIIQNPLSQTNGLGGTVTFSVGITNPATLPIGYRWRRGGSTVVNHIVNARTDFFTITNIQPGDAGSYTVIVTNEAFFAPGVQSAIATLVIMSPLDTDGDGMPDSFEIQYNFATNNVSDATQDADGDGVSNRDEYNSGTNPRDPNSYLRVEAVAGSGRVRLLFKAVENKSYSVQYRANLRDATWQFLAGVPASSSTSTATRSVEVIDPVPPGPGERIYRLVTPGMTGP